MWSPYTVIRPISPIRLLDPPFAFFFTNGNLCYFLLSCIFLGMEYMFCFSMFHLFNFITKTRLLLRYHFISRLIFPSNDVTRSLYSLFNLVARSLLLAPTMNPYIEPRSPTVVSSRWALYRPLWMPIKGARGPRLGKFFFFSFLFLSHSRALRKYNPFWLRRQHRITFCSPA